MSAVSSFYDFLVFDQEIQMNPIPAFKKRYLGHVRYHPEIRQLISIREMQDLFKESDLDFSRKIIRIPDKAKRSNNIAFMDDELEITLKEYLVWRKRRAKTDWLLISFVTGLLHIFSELA